MPRDRSKVPDVGGEGDFPCCQDLYLYVWQALRSIFVYQSR